MAGDAGRLVAERQECRDWPIPAEPAAEEFGGEQELGEGASEGEGNAGRRLQNVSIPFALAKKLPKVSAIQIASSTSRLP